MTWEVYLLSICNVPSSIAVVTTIVTIICIFASLMFLVITSELRQENENDEYIKLYDGYAKIFTKLTIMFAIVSILLCLVPTREDIIEAYIIKEGASLITAENANETIDGLMERLDKVINHITKE